jgi:hypothetical protein
MGAPMGWNEEKVEEEEEAEGPKLKSGAPAPSVLEVGVATALPWLLSDGMAGHPLLGT